MIVQESTTQVVTIPTKTPTTVPHTSSSLEESTPVSSVAVEKEIAVETTLVAAKSDNGEILKTADLILLKETIRTPTKTDPLSVVTIGDSVSSDADPGIKAV